MDLGNGPSKGWALGRHVEQPAARTDKKEPDAGVLRTLVWKEAFPSLHLVAPEKHPVMEKFRSKRYCAMNFFSFVLQ